jgi:hypothetical protein
VRAFIVNMENRPGALADLGEALGAVGINISGLAGTTWKEKGSVAIITNDDAGARTVLEERDIEYRDVEVVSASLEDRPGALGVAARRLADRGINIEVVMPTGVQGGRVSVAFGVDDPAGAREALGDLAAATHSI